ncbi:MAG: sugar phosphate isomerase/epimerase [Clostridia bacterium]|nr:sugar phosphate isomerase/epimerase [Clostridia bacterium]
MTNRKDWAPAVSTSWGTLSPAFYKSLAAADIHHVEISGKDRAFWDELNFVNNADAIVREMREYDISPSSIHLPFCPFETMDPTTGDTAQRERIAAYHGEILRAAADAGISVAVIHPSGEPYRAFERGERMKCAIDTLQKVTLAAQTCGIRLAVENLPRTCLGNIHEEITLMTNEIPGLCVCFDTNHSLRQANPDVIRALGDRIITLHLSDYDMIDERHLLPFLGRNDWHAIMLALEETGYNGYLTFEVWPKGVLTTECLRLSYNKLMEI